MLLALSLLSAGQLSACSQAGEIPASVRDVLLTDVRVLISEESVLLADPADLAVDSVGRVYVLDELENRVQMVRQDGEVVHLLGRPGQGPGEFLRPIAIGVQNGRIRVFDFAQLSLQEFEIDDGQYIDSTTPEVVGIPWRVAFGPEWRLAYSGLTLPSIHGALVGVVDERGRQTHLLGELVSDEVSSPTNTRDFALDHSFPGRLRNQVLPVFGPDGRVWVIQQTEGVVQVFDVDGSLAAEFGIALPELAVIKQEFFNWYASSPGRTANRVFESIEDAVVTDGGSLWLLWNLPRDRPPLMTIHDIAGTVATRLVLDVGAEETHPSQELPPRRQFALDLPRGRILFLDGPTLVEVSMDGYERRPE
jgi:hypothetical protein